jgi:hypothetical protein
MLLEVVDHLVRPTGRTKLEGGDTGGRPQKWPVGDSHPGGPEVAPG